MSRETVAQFRWFYQVLIEFAAKTLDVDARELCAAHLIWWKPTPDAECWRVLEKFVDIAKYGAYGVYAHDSRVGETIKEAQALLRAREGKKNG
jgi:aryl-alcohol dehydrogenase-like predicted oxidoreductase